jgi:hypothetical protein
MDGTQSLKKELIIDVKYLEMDGTIVKANELVNYVGTNMGANLSL